MRSGSLSGQGSSCGTHATTSSALIWCSTTRTESSVEAFDESLRQRGVRPRRLRPRSPNLNAFVERWIQSIQIECLNHFMVLGRGAFESPGRKSSSRITTKSGRTRGSTTS